MSSKKPAKAKGKARGSPKVRIETLGVSTLPTDLQKTIQPVLRKSLRLLPKKTLNSLLVSKQSYSLSVAFVSPKEIHRINSKFRSKNEVTDVLSFSRIHPLTKKQPLAAFPHEIGDVILCWDYADKNRVRFGTTPKQELGRLLVHGLLHLFGYDHEKSAKEARTMFELQESLLKKLRLTP